MKLKTINWFLKRVGLVLVVETDSCEQCVKNVPHNTDHKPTKLWLERVGSYSRRTRKER